MVNSIDNARFISIENFAAKSGKVTNFILGVAIGDKIADVFEVSYPIHYPLINSLIRKTIKVITGLAAMTSESEYFISVALVALTTLNLMSKVMRSYEVVENIEKERKKREGEPPDYLVDMVAQAAQIPRRSFSGMDSYIENLEIALGGGEIKNVILVGPAGCGKTAIIEDLASRIAHKKIGSDSLFQNKRIYQLDFNGLMAGRKAEEGAMYLGMLESKVRDVLKFLEEEPDVILFIDEIHRIDGAGASTRSRGPDLANLLKERLGRSGITVIGATTEEEYTIHIQRDLALKRRFCKVDVEAPTSSDCIERITHQITYFQERYPGFELQQEAISAAVFFVVKYKSQEPLLHESLQLIHQAISSQKREAIKRTGKNQEVVRDVVPHDNINFKVITPSVIAKTFCRMFKKQPPLEFEKLLNEFQVICKMDGRGASLR